MDKSQTWYEKHSDVPQEMKHISKSMFPPEDEDLVEKMHLERWWVHGGALRQIGSLKNTGSEVIELKQTKQRVLVLPLSFEVALVVISYALREDKWDLKVQVQF